MSSLLDMYQDLSTEDKEKLGKQSSKIRTPGCHLVEIVEAVEIDGNRIRVDFKTAAGETADWTGWLTTKDSDGNTIPKTSTLSQLTYICNAVGLKIADVLGRTKDVAKPSKKNPDARGLEFTALAKKKLYITTTTVIEGDDNKPETVYVKQEVNPFKFFDTKKRNALEIASKAPEGVTMETADAEAKAALEIGYKFTDNAACERKFKELSEKMHAANPAATTGVIGGNTAPASTATENDDDI